LAIAATGLPFGLATEGGFGPDPVIGIVALHREIAAVVDDVRGFIRSEHFNSHETNHAGRELCNGDTIDDAQLQR
jgi:hypothetical protein